MSTTYPGAPGPEPRIGDSEREAAVKALGEHYAAGRLTKEEFDERADAAWAARTRSGLWPLFRDLPHPAAPPPERPPAPPRAFGPGRARPEWGVVARLLPLLIIVAVLMALTHLPVLLLLLVWVFWAKTHGVRSRRRGRPHDRR
jgi:uncharacterized membrane protein